MALLTRKGLLQKEKLQIKKVELNDDSFVFVKQMSAKDKSEMQSSMLIEHVNEKGVSEFETDLSNMSAKLVVFTCCDEQGNLLLKKEDVDVLSENMGAVTMDLISEAAASLNGMSLKGKVDIAKK